MRKDIAKVLVTRPRIRSRWNHNGGGRSAMAANDDLPSHESMRSRHVRTNNAKELNEYLSPLRRFIEGKVGHRWDDVYSEIRSLIKAGNTIHEHILEHVDGYIAITVVADDRSQTGMVSHNKLTQRYDRRMPVNPGDIYVDPKDGIIKRAKRLAPAIAKATRAPTYHTLSKYCVAVQIEGIWYAVDLKDYEERRREVPYIEAVTGKARTRTVISYIVDGRIVDTLGDRIASEVNKVRTNDSGSYRYSFGSYRYHAGPDERTRAYGRPGVFGYRKRQLSHKELVRLGLTNNLLAKAA